MKIYEGKLTAEGVRIGIVAARGHEFIVSKLLGGCEDTLLRHGVQPDDISVAWVPGAFELPLVAQRMAQSGHYDAVIALGAVIGGSADEIAKSVAAVGLRTNVPTLFGVLTADTIQQAMESGGMGAQCAENAIEMVNLGKAMGDLQ